MSHKEHKRKKLFTDWAVQGTLLLHILGHWVLFLVATSALLFCLEMLTAEVDEAAAYEPLRRYKPIVIAVLVLAPVFFYDLCKLSNRFAGPMVRLQRGLRDLAEGRDISPIKFRKRDFWHYLADDFNRVLERVQRVEGDHSDVDSALALDAEQEPSSEPCEVPTASS